MGRTSLAILCLCCSSAFAQRQPVTEVHTALNHLTVIQLAEPITEAAAGSDAFEIQRHGNQAFIEPYRANVSTDLLLRTASSETMYELDAPGEVKDMDVLILSKPQADRTASAARHDSEIHDSAMQKIADLVMTKTLLQTQPISQRDAKLSRGGVSVQVEEVVQGRDSLYLRYQVVNDSPTPYRILTPSVEVIRTAQSPVSLQSLRYSQLSSRTVARLGPEQMRGIPVVRSEIPRRNVAPGSVASGVLAIRVASPGPHIYRLIFGNNGVAPVSATVVL